MVIYGLLLFLLLGYVFRIFYFSILLRESGPVLGWHSFLADARLEIGMLRPLNDPPAESYVHDQMYAYKSKRIEFFYMWGEERLQCR